MTAVLRCLACGDRLSPVRTRLGALRCQDCDDGLTSLRPEGCTCRRHAVDPDCVRHVQGHKLFALDEGAEAAPPGTSTPSSSANPHVGAKTASDPAAAPTVALTFQPGWMA